MPCMREEYAPAAEASIVFNLFVNFEQKQVSYP